ncbi:hypothetical protein DKX38_013965 [Salix brachista]|uniref:VOC domain-containing protein n=1 Tax=Salix brachista TaxID=2182728 RepID=A0A5N5LFV0_9ROSI|nr:hypothetical protein DKX38_013965 [Salix brachista]
MEKKEEADNNREERNNEGKEEREDGRVPQMALNHISRLCRNVKESIDFYTKVLGLVLIERPPTFNFDGAWLFNYGVGVHLIQAKNEDSLPKTDRRLDPMYNHVSFQCEDMKALEQRLKQFNVEYTTRTMDDDRNGTRIDQLFFRDSDGYVIEICNCENLKLVPAGSLGSIKLPCDRHNPPVDLENGHHPK